MRHHNISRLRGFTLIEMAVVISIIAILATILLNRVLFYSEQAEKTAMDQTLGTLRSALHLQIAGALLHGNVADAAKLTEQNPMNWLAEKPANYVGEFYSPKPGVIATGSWYFDVPTKSLVYLAHSHEYLHATPEGSYRLQFKMHVLMSAQAPSSGDTSNQKQVEGVVLEPVTNYRWF